MNFDNIGANEIIAIVLVVFAILGFLKSMVKTFFTIIALSAGGVAGMWGYNNGFSIAKKVVETPAPWMSTAVAVIAFIGAFSFVRTILRFLSGHGKEGSQTRSLGFGLPGGVMGLCLGGGLLYALLSGVRYGGTLSELKHLQDYVSGQVEKSSDSPLLAKIKTWIDSSQIGQWHQKIDLLNDPAEAQLAKLAIVTQDKETIAKAIVISEEEIPYALPVDESTEEIIAQKDFAALLKKARELGVDVDAEKLLRMNIEKALGIQE